SCSGVVSAAAARREIYLLPLSYSSRRSPSVPLFPYTTLFRSYIGCIRPIIVKRILLVSLKKSNKFIKISGRLIGLKFAIHKTFRSEEHTSELQSRENLVCRLLLEKKKLSKSEYRGR